MTSTLCNEYKKNIISTLRKTFGYKSIMQVPKIEKIVLNMGVGDAAKDIKYLESAINEFTLITGQKPLITKAKKSIANFKLRAGQPIGIKITLRNEKMWAFLEKLIHIVIPRVKDFRGLSLKAFDGHGNYTIGLKEQIIFPEIVYDDVKKIRGFDITIVTSTNDDKQAEMLLRLLGLPLAKEKNQ